MNHIIANIATLEGQFPNLSQQLRATLAEQEGYDPYFRIHEDGSMTDCNCSDIPELVDMLRSPKAQATGIAFILDHLDHPPMFKVQDIGAVRAALGAIIPPQ
jgi:hypothetical protein